MAKTHKVLIVKQLNVLEERLMSTLSKQYEITFLATVGDAYRTLEYNNDFDLALIDIEELKKDSYLISAVLSSGYKTGKRVPVIAIQSKGLSQEDNFDIYNRVFDVVSITNDAYIWMRRMENACLYYSILNNGPSGDMFSMSFGGQSPSAKANSDFITMLADAIESRDDLTGGHVKRVSDLVRILSTQLLDMYPEKYRNIASDIDDIASASLLHDIGKIAIKDAILLKQDPFTPTELDIMKSHTTEGAKLLHKHPDFLNSKFQNYAYNIALMHHEAFDGSGYPMHLKHEEIPIEAQLVSVVDCFDAGISKRVYKAAKSPYQVSEEIIQGENKKFSGDMINAFKAAKPKLIEYMITNV